MTTPASARLKPGWSRLSAWWTGVMADRRYSDLYRLMGWVCILLGITLGAYDLHGLDVGAVFVGGWFFGRAWERGDD